ncbi:MAG TPA: TIGR03088 family PEP-CTERM/XrtA system glycosyltransferase [Rhodanobacteraceae bacterium]|nr:TIGR03088 family PEP-CTERM/XrtA system glycosyltransferase [Rhodanobacteraceae bacterium]
MNDKPLIAHVLYRLDTGGMERVALSVINHTRERYRHAVICLAGYGTLRSEIVDADVPCLSLDKRPGKDPGCYLRLWRALRTLKPDLVQTYNIGALDAAPVVRLAGVRRIVHAEHGRDVTDPNGDNPRYLRLRHWMAPFIDRFITVSRDLQHWLVERARIRPDKVTCIPNGIDVAAFTVPGVPPRPRVLLRDFAPPGSVLIANVARLDKVKDQAGLLAAFKLLQERAGQQISDFRLIIVGGGPEHEALQRRVEQLGLTRTVRLLGNRSDVATLLAESDVFVLSSIAEGMPVTLMEAMASGLPVVATGVGDVAAVVENGTTGTLVPPGDAQALAEALGAYVTDEALRHRHGDAGRARVAARFSLNAMLSAYTALYDELLGRQASASQPRVAAGLAGRGEH